MKKIILIIIGILTGIVVILAGLYMLLISALSNGHMQTDQQMIENFYKHAEDFDILATTSTQHSNTAIDRIGPYVSTYRDKNGSLFITTYSYGLVTGGEEKGYVYLPYTPDTIVNSIDQSKSSAKSLVPIFRKINSNWYLYYSYDD